MDLTGTFNAAAGGPEGAGEAVSEGPPSPGPAPPNASAQVPFAPPEAPLSAPNQITVESAQAELETLERGRAKPAPRNEPAPPPKKKIIDSKIERDREARVSALNAYIEFQQIELAVDAAREQSEELELNW